MQLAAFPLRDLRYLRENNTQAYSINIAQTKPQGLPQISQMTQTNPRTTKPQNNKTTITTPTTPPTQPVFLCGIMQLAAFLCVICAICGRITRKRTQSIPTDESLNISRRSLRYRRQTAIPTLTPICLSLRNNAACCIRLRNLRNLWENIRKRTQSICTNEIPISPADLADDADEPQNNKTTKTALTPTNLSFSAK